MTSLNPRIKLSIDLHNHDQQWLPIIKEQLKERLIHGDLDHFILLVEEDQEVVMSFNPFWYEAANQRLNESFRKMVMEPMEERKNSAEGH